ncbi:EAL domain-containing protein [Bacillus sp. BGMRC 2118]|nr:EAL domain-containing protein [Bacillus sp. BGMRC 2118]
MDQEQFMSLFESSIGLNDVFNAIENMGVGLTIVDARLEDLPLVYINQGFTQMTGYEKEDVLLKNCRFLQGEDTDRKQVEKIKSAIEECRPETVTLKNYRKDGTYFWNQFIISPIMDKKGRPLYFIGLQFDVTQQVENEKGAKQLISDLSMYDQLTGFLNIDHFKELLQQHIDDSSQPFAIYRVNLNRFRNINTSYGETKSDEVLVEVATRLRSIYPHALITRSFADDFIIFHDLQSSENIQHSLYAMEKALVKPYSIASEKVKIDFSIGISQSPENGHEVEPLLGYASLAMREAKLTSSTHHCFFNESLSKRLEARMTIEKNFEKALENKEFVLHYQPKVSANTSELIGMEALVRWEDPEKGLISPAEFIPIAEDTGFIVPLGDWILEEACRMNKEWQNQGFRTIPVSVNVSALQFMQPQFTDKVLAVLQETGLAPEFLEVEITESLLINPTLIIERLQELKRIGVRISIDDFGTGYSSIHYLKDLPIDTLKIDRAFVKETPHSVRDNSLLLSIIQLGKSLGLNVLAEGAEDEKQVDFLREGHCDSIQGYYFSRPLQSEQMEEMLRK